MLKYAVGQDQKVSALYLVSIVFAVIFTWLLHEFAHWTVSEWLGYDTILSLNGTYPAAGEYDKAPWHYLAVSAAGPLITLLQAVAVFGHLRFNEWVKYLYPLLFTPFYMRLLAAIMNFINLNDEGRISVHFGLGTFTLPILVSAILLLTVFVTSRYHRLRPRLQVTTILTIMVVSSILILADQFFTIRIL